MKKSAILVSLLTLTNLYLVTACQPVSQLTSLCSGESCVNPKEVTSANLSHFSETLITGKVEFPSFLPSIGFNRGNGGEFATKALQSDISKQATVSLIYTSDYNGIFGTTYRNKTIATGLSQDDGSFVVKPGVLFSPELNIVYILEATKRIGGFGSDNMALRTYLKWNGAGWDSMTTPGIYINATTTALAIIQEGRKYNVNSLQTIGKINTLNGSSVPLNIGIDVDKVVFSSNRTGNNEIFIMNADGSATQQLTNNSADDIDPSFSPDGSKIVFTSNRDGNQEIYLMDVNGNTQTRLTNFNATDEYASFSPDGSKILFSSYRSGNSEVFIMETNGDNQTNVTNNSGSDMNPSMSPDGSKIAFASTRSGGWAIWTMDANGSNPIKLTAGNTDDLMSFFSPDESKIVFYSTRTGNYEIWSMNPDGTNQTNLSNNSYGDDSPSFSPDGSKIVWAAYRTGNAEIYMMNSDGNNQVNLTQNSSTDEYPSYYSNFISAFTVTNVSDLVTQVLSKNHDPMEYIKSVNGQFSIVNPTPI